MATYIYIYLMEHPHKGRMSVPQAKHQEYLDKGYVDVERIEREEFAPAPKAKAKTPAKKKAKK